MLEGQGLQSQEINKLAEALSKAQGTMRSATKDKINPHFRSKYATLSAIQDAVREPLSTNGLSYSQTTTILEHEVVLRTTLMHASGQWLSSVYPIRPVKNDPQGMGSALTYAKRYSLSAILGIDSEEDDDGNAATFSDDKKKESASFTMPGTSSSKEGSRASPSSITTGDKKITDKQGNLLFVKAKNKGWSILMLNDWLQKNFNISDSRDLPFAKFNEVLEKIDQS